MKEPKEFPVLIKVRYEGKDFWEVATGKDEMGNIIIWGDELYETKKAAIQTTLKELPNNDQRFLTPQSWKYITKTEQLPQKTKAKILAHLI